MLMPRTPNLWLFAYAMRVAVRLLPVTRAQFHWPTRTHVIHDLLDTPGLVLVALGVVGLELVLILHVDALFETLCALLVVLVCVRLGIVAPYPLGQLRGGTTRVKLDLVPVGVLEELGIGEAEFLGAGVADETADCYQ